MTNVGEEIKAAVKKGSRGKYVRAKSEKGGIQDQMNCLVAFMEGFRKEAVEDSSSVDLDDGKLCVTDFESRKKSQVYQYRSGKVQWQISAIELHSKIWKLTLVQMFTLGEYLYCYCPGFTGSSDDYIRLTQLGRRVGLRSNDPMEALTMAKYDKAMEVVEQAKQMLEALGHAVKFEIS